MKALKSFRFIMAFILALLLAVPPVVLARDSRNETAKRFSQEELDQILAPVALYPDSLLAQVLMASTYPLEVVMADRWVKQNKNLSGDKLKEAADKQSWDPSVKALVPFPDLLSTMADKVDWTQKLGDAFLAQQSDVMETVQSLRKKAYEAGNLKSTNEQNIIVEKEIIRIEPADSRVVYVPVYDPWWVYGPWWWPYYPPYVFYPYPYPAAVYYPGYIGFSVGFVVGAYWGNWGYCNWPHRTVYVNPYYYGRPYSRYGRAPVGSAIAAGGRAPGPGPSQPTSRSRPVGSLIAPSGSPAVQKWAHDPDHRRGVAYRDSAVGRQFGQTGRTTADNRRLSRSFEDNMARRTAVTKADVATRTGTIGHVGRTAGGSYGSIDRRGKPETSFSQTRQDRTGADRMIGNRSAGRTSPSIGRSGRIDTSSTPRKVIEQSGFGRQPIDRAYRPPAAQGGALSAPAGVNRGIAVPKPGNWARGAGVPSPKAQNWTGISGGQGRVGGAFSQGGFVGSGGGRMGGWSGGGGGFPRGGPSGAVGGAVGGGGFRGGR
ncbi:MAG: DUF3300 domain-containing protein [Syntrophales bacterium]